LARFWHALRSGCDREARQVDPHPRRCRSRSPIPLKGSEQWRVPRAAAELSGARSRQRSRVRPWVGAPEEGQLPAVTGRVQALIQVAKPCAGARQLSASSTSKFLLLAFLRENDPSIHVRVLWSTRALYRLSSSPFESPC